MRVCKVNDCNNIHYGKGYCRKHYDHIRNYGKILKRTIATRNNIFVNGDFCKMELYDIKHNVIGITIFDKKYLDKIKPHKWGISVGYVSSRIKGKLVFLHHFIKGKKDNNFVDHINRNTLDNRYCNLRFVNHSQSVWNTKSKGYSYHKGAKKWMVEIMKNYKKHYIGLFNTEEEARQARIEAEIKYFGEYAQIR